ncbi:hypothetical protein E4T56_gene16773 [Termitomyces sp. T112]|nr:hypothetical protein E4T56_gene16773 [Termitomyces sp. T112]
MSPALASDSSAPSVMECVIRHKCNGAKYSCADGNFTQWSEKLKDAMILNGIYAYVFDPFLSCPNSNTKPHAHANWNLNDCLAITFLRSALEDIEHRDLVMDKSVRHCFEDLKTQAQQEGPIKQIALLQKALLTYCSQSESLPVTASWITNIVKLAFDIGKISTDLFTCIALLNSLNDPSFEALQNSVSTLLSKSMKDLPCSPMDIWLLMENAQNIINSKANTTATVLNAKGGIKPHNTNLPGHNHGPGAKGGGMAGKSIADAQNAQRASKKKPKAPSTNTSAQTKSFVAVTRLDGKLWYVDPINLRQLPALPKTAAFTGIAGTQSPTIALDHSTKCWEHTGFMVFEDPRMTILDWDNYTKPIEDHIMAMDISPISTARKNPLTSLTSIPFLVDSGATIHISPCRDDFFTLCPILPCSVKGLGGSSVAAIGIGSIWLRVAKGAHIILEDVLYIPNATVCLISVSSLTNKGLDSHFDNVSIKIMNRSSCMLIAHGPLIPNQRLYSLNLNSAFTEHRALTTHHTTNLETWHHHLGHANYQTIIDMAKSGMVPVVEPGRVLEQVSASPSPSAHTLTSSSEDSEAKNPDSPITPDAPPNCCPCPVPILVGPDATPANSDASLANSDSPLANFNAFPAATDTYPGSPKLREPSPLFPIFTTHHQLNTLVPLTHSGVSRQPRGDPRSPMIPSTYQHGLILNCNRHPPTPSSSAKLCHRSRHTPKFSGILSRLHSVIVLIIVLYLHSNLLLFYIISSDAVSVTPSDRCAQVFINFNNLTNSAVTITNPNTPSPGLNLALRSVLDSINSK